MSSVIGLYRPGSSVLHRLPPGVKLTALILLGIGSIFITRPILVLAAVMIVTGLYAVASLPLWSMVGLLRPLAWVLVPLAAFQVIVVGWQRAWVTIGVILTLALAAHLVTLTTRTSDLIDCVVAVVQRVPGLSRHAERLGLLLNLAIRSVPLVATLAGKVREAQHARGHSVSARAFAVPLIVGALRQAETMGDALAARGADQ